jgi:hypothetical protein
MGTMFASPDSLWCIKSLARILHGVMLISSKLPTNSTWNFMLGTWPVKYQWVHLLVHLVQAPTILPVMIP